MIFLMYEVIFSVFSENAEAGGALLVGLGAISTSLLSIRGTKRRAQDDCEKRIHELGSAFKAGIKYEPRKPPTQGG